MTVRAEAKVKVGQWILLFGTVAEVRRVTDSAAFPGMALQILLRTMGGQTTTTLVPTDYEPTLIPWSDNASGPGPAPRPGSTRTG